MNEMRNQINTEVKSETKSIAAGETTSRMNHQAADETNTETVKQTTNGQPLENCPQCRRELVGAIEVSEGIIGGISMVVMRETPNRNWIVCDFCNRTVCKSCCVMPDSGYCDECFIEYKLRTPY